MDKQTNQLHFRRFEFKYLLDEEVSRAIKSDIKHFLTLDPYVREKEGYWVNTIYLDNQHFACYWEKTDGLFFRKKLRFRVYGKKKDSAIFLELKRKEGDIILKDRSVVARKQFSGVFESSLAYLLKKKKGAELEFMRECAALKWQMNLEPVLLITYFRQAFISPYQDLRLTFDTQIRGAKLRDFSFNQDSDQERDILDKLSVFELKFTGSLPYWLYHIIRKYNLEKEPFSKYCQGIERVFQESI